MKWRCPICKKPTGSATHPEFPFCSERFRLIDLSNWAAEEYAVPEPALEEPTTEKPDPEKQQS